MQPNEIKRRRCKKIKQEDTRRNENYKKRSGMLYKYFLDARSRSGD